MCPSSKTFSMATLLLATNKLKQLQQLLTVKTLSGQNSSKSLTTLPTITSRWWKPIKAWLFQWLDRRSLTKRSSCWMKLTSKIKKKVISNQFLATSTRDRPLIKILSSMMVTTLNVVSKVASCLVDRSRELLLRERSLENQRCCFSMRRPLPWMKTPKTRFSKHLTISRLAGAWSSLLTDCPRSRSARRSLSSIKASSSRKAHLINSKTRAATFPN